MDKSHTVCQQCVAQHYWHHMDDQKCFFKIIVGDFKNGVAIPKKFATNVRGQISEEVKLEVPNGNTYNVKVDVEQNDLIIGPGWATFSSAYDLKSGDFLVFTYSGHSHFKVRIFDPSGCEKEFSCVPMDGIPCVQERSVSQGNHKQSPTREKLVKRCIGISGQSRKTLKMSPTDSPSEKTSIEEPMNSGGFQKSTKCCFVLPSGCSMTNEQKARINTLIKKIRPQVPLYITTIDKTTVAGGFLAISKDYAIKYLLDANGSIKLSQLDGVKIWAINLDINTGSLYALSTCWMDFIRDNKLQDGDICIFQPSKGKKGVTLIFHPLEESCCPQLPGFVPSAKSPRHGVPKPPYMLPQYTALNDQQKSKVDKKVRAIQSEFPIYVSIMQNSNITRNLCILQIGSKYATTYLPRENQTMRLWRPSKDGTWEAELQVKNKRHRLGRGWRQFVHDNKLKLGDICLFQLMKNKKLTMIVHIIRKRAM